MFVRIAFTRSLAEAGRVKSLLESRGFHPAPMDAFSHVPVAGPEQGFHVEILNTEVKAACSLLRQEGLGRCLTQVATEWN